jgi:hypothetical protein
MHSGEIRGHDVSSPLISLISLISVQILAALIAFPWPAFPYTYGVRFVFPRRAPEKILDGAHPSTLSQRTSGGAIDLLR